ncbi:outer membrane protein assembly factor BamE [Halomonas sp. McH1-25]|uniref:outer membrane protein assembly factor BamE domain-containing protein n=1 Tax=unclassified Halomonas TaxID=2609666 RepID=UPI001EF50AE5|nr:MULTISPECIES: outer membrane protein assembly factor BamE [unclassified Halomonas]MCG7599509.1 outer membrane protein assembly factor BamE [Halomonas sp. McH1-25]MCP1343664.1 outer membrane protein assembly factor BamE [Halomonas sp. FL8]MCP1361951.1 outer membrane protein assembly factor BamE [Halomonas sp. BBD45]MCP1366863.1 outer membrane protein assembly factor BamE [Halomonas sp. BBD48]
MRQNVWAATIVAAALGLAGCEDARLTLDNYQQLQAGMSRAQVEAILGEPSECSGAVMIDNCLWGDESRFVQAQFVAGKAMTYQYQGLK